jgi:predicted nucleic acid-binding protein
VILVDTSAWVEFLRATESSVDLWLRDAIVRGERLATTGVVVMELLAGARDELHAVQLRRFLGRWSLLPAEEPSDHEVAASVYRECRRSGRTIRRLPDCLVAAVALRTKASIVHRDADFDAIAGVVSLRIVEVRGSV